MDKYMIWWALAASMLLVVNVLYALGIGSNHQLAGTVCGVWYMYFAYKFTREYKRETAA